MSKLSEKIYFGRYGNKFVFIPTISTEESFGHINLTFEFLTFYLNIKIKSSRNDIMSDHTQDKLIEFFESLDKDISESDRGTKSENSNN